MYKHINLIIIITMLFAGISCRVNHPFTVQHVTELETGHSQQGFYYALPRNVITVDVTVVKTEEIPGPFAQYAEDFLGLEDVIKRASTQFTIDDIAINSYSEPDPGEFYFVELDSKKHLDTPFSMMLNEVGIISAINSTMDTSEVSALSTQKNIQGIFGTQATFNQFLETNLHERIDTILERVKMDTVMVERKTLRRTWVEKTSEIRAREVADYILRIRNKRFDVVSGFAEITYSKEALEYMNEQLMKMENDYLELFTGITQQSEIKYRFSIVPEKEKAGDPVTLFFFDEKRGIQDQPHSDTQVVKINISRDFTSRQMGVFTLDPEKRRAMERGFFYRIPEHAHINITVDAKLIAESRLLVSQYGITTSLPPDNLKIEYHQNSGTIKSIERNDY